MMACQPSILIDNPFQEIDTCRPGWLYDRQRAAPHYSDTPDQYFSHGYLPVCWSMVPAHGSVPKELDELKTSRLEPANDLV